MNTRIPLRSALALSFSVLAMTGCYVVPVVGPDGAPQYYAYPLPPAGTQLPPPARGSYSPAPTQPLYSGTPMPTALAARLYPDNDAASQVGPLNGTVTNMMTGKGRFQLDYRGEVLVGEATRVSGEERKGVASAYGQRGTYMSCEYQMNTPLQGAGTCMFSTGARYKVHIGG